MEIPLSQPKQTKKNYKIVVCCPGNMVTGGPELLHQLVYHLNELGFNATIAYFPFSREFETPEKYKKYNVKIEKFQDLEENIVITPETATWVAKLCKKSSCYIWWLSVYYYFQIPNPTIIGYLRSLRHYLLGRRIDFSQLRKINHLTQSEHARLFLEKRKIKSSMLSDYISDDYLMASRETFQDTKERENLILYNPKKGIQQTQKLIRLNPQFRFLALENMDSQQLRRYMQTAKVYIDFGNHPGKDRLPREAALLGCCIVTGLQGSASNPIDIPIPNKYKLDELSTAFSASFAKLIQSIFEDYNQHIIEFNSYIHIIQKEKGKFVSEIENIFGLYK